MTKQHDKQFKLNAVRYYEDHKDLGIRGCAENLGIGYSTLTKWKKFYIKMEISPFVVQAIMRVMNKKKLFG